MSGQAESVNFLKNINSLYGGNTYLEKNGMSIIVAGAILVVVFSVITYAEVGNHLHAIRQDWPSNRCSPRYMPLAGFINAPAGESKWAYTAQNFSFCVNSLLGDLTSFATNPVKMATALMQQTLATMNTIMGKLGEFISTIRTDVINFAKDVVARVMNLLVPIISMWHKLEDILKRSTGVMGFVFYFIDIVFFTVISWVNLVVKVIADWVLYIFEILGISGLILIVVVMAGTAMMLASLASTVPPAVMEVVGAAEMLDPFTLPIGIVTEGVADVAEAAATSWAISATIAAMIVRVVAFVAVAAIVIVIQVYEALVIDPMMDLMGLFPGLIKTPPDKNLGDTLWWANALNMTKGFVQPIDFKTTAQMKKNQAAGAAVNSAKKSPSGMSISGEMAKGKESFRNMFY